MAARRPEASSAPEPLKAYREKRDFSRSPEPKPVRRAVPRAKQQLGGRFVVQKHAARRLHFDLRLELDGVLKSWAVTRGPSLVPGEKRLAVETEDHPLQYLDFEGVIPAGEYGGGTMIVWDQGRWVPEGDPADGLERGTLTFALHGERLGGRWRLVRMRRRARETREQWLLLKSDDAFARAPGTPEVTEEHLTSLLSGSTNEELAAGGEVRADHRARETARREPRARAPKGARKGLLPVFVEPCLAELVEAAPVGPEWIHEIKFDGYRVQARIDGEVVRLLTRSGLDWTERFGPVAEAWRALGLGSALVDGELVVEDEAGLSSFSGLQADLKAKRTDRLCYYAFDLLYLDGRDLRALPLLDRKVLLASLLDDVPQGGVIRFSQHVERDGEAMVRHACRLGLEGIVSKRADRPYRSGRTGDWSKAKCTERQEFVVAGFVPSTASSRAVGSLVLGFHEAGRLVHAGRVGTGFSGDTARELWREFQGLARPAPPFDDPLSSDAARGARWVEPRLVAEVEFRGWTGDGLLRHASFKGLREDKDPSEVVREGRTARPREPAREPSVRLTHPDRVLWPDAGLTKQGLAEFYAEIAGAILPHVVDRPLSLVRCPGGTGESCFFQKHAWKGMPQEIGRKMVAGDEVLFVRGLEGLLSLVQSGVLEIHPWGSTLAAIERPDTLTLDLDPDEEVPWTALVQAAFDARERLRAAGLESFVKTTGGKGLHVVAPLVPKAGWDAVKAFAQATADAMARDAPDRYTAKAAKAARRGRVYVDYLRNARGATAVAAYSTRARPGATVSTPIAWSELSPLVRPSHFTVSTLATRLRHLRADPWAEFREVRQTLPGKRP